jgi:hypothetical protein
MLRNSFLILLLFALSGCATPEPGIKIETQIVKVPIAVPCKATIPSKPEFNFDKLTIDEDIFVKIRSLLADRLLYRGHETELLAALNSCIK